MTENWKAKQKQIFVDIAAGIAMKTVQNQQAAMGYHHAREDQKEQ